MQGQFPQSQNPEIEQKQRDAKFFAAAWTDDAARLDATDGWD